MSLDFFASVWLTITYCVKLCNLYLTGMRGYLTCQFITSELFIWVGLFGSVTRIVTIMLERYAKLVHPVLHKKYFRKWMIYVGVVISWVSGFLQNFIVSRATTNIGQGQCLENVFWPSHLALNVYTAIYMLASFVLPLCIFVCCYGHILVVIRRRAKVFGGDNAASDSLQASALRAQVNVIKTMLAIVAFFVVSWIPSEIYSLLNVVYYNFNFENDAWFAITSLAFMNVCVDTPLSVTSSRATSVNLCLPYK